MRGAEAGARDSKTWAKTRGGPRPGMHGHNEVSGESFTNVIIGKMDLVLLIHMLVNLIVPIINLANVTRLSKIKVNMWQM